MEKLANFIGKHRVLGASTTHGAIRIGPGEVKWTSRGTIKLGAFINSDLEPVEPRVDRFISALDEAGLQPIWSEDIAKTIWTKLLLNVAINPVCAIAGIMNGEMLFHPELFETGLAAMEEAARIATAEGIDLSESNALDEFQQNVIETMEKLCQECSRQRQCLWRGCETGGIAGHPYAPKPNFACLGQGNCAEYTRLIMV